MVRRLAGSPAPRRIGKAVDTQASGVGAVMRVALVVISGKSNVREVLLGDDTLIGRSPDCRLKVASTEVSRKHCRIRVRGQQVLVSDLGSSNGTLLNGKPLAPMTEVVAPPKSRLTIGPLEFVVDYQPGKVAIPAVVEEAEAEGHTIVDRVAAPATAAPPSVASVAAAMGSARGAVTAPMETPLTKSAVAESPDSTLFDLGLDPQPDALALVPVESPGASTNELPMPIEAALSAESSSDVIAPPDNAPGAVALPMDDDPLLAGLEPLVAPEPAGDPSEFDKALQDFLKGL